MSRGRRSSSASHSSSRGRGRKRGGREASRNALPEPPEFLSRLLGRGRIVQPRKSLGQHYLVDEFLLGDIAEATVRDASVPVLEIGAGPGGLTDELAQRAETVVAIELDEELSSLTRSRLAHHPGLHVIAADVLQFEPAELLAEAGVDVTTPGNPFVAVGNLPYYITQPIVRKLLEATPGPERIVVLVQREVAHRIVGGEGRESLLSMSVKMYGSPRLLFDVPKEAFWPPPKVQSAVVEIERYERPALDLTRAEIEAFFHVVRAGFAQPRKKVSNSLSDESGIERVAITSMLEAASIEPSKRPQHLSLQDWERVYREFMTRFPGMLDVGDAEEPPPFDPSEWDKDEADEGDDGDRAEDE